MVTLAPQYPISKAKLFSGLAPVATVTVSPYVAVLGTPNEEINAIPFQPEIVSICA